MKHWLERENHVFGEFHYDNLTIMNKLYLMMKERRNCPYPMNPRLAQYVKGSKNPQNLK